ncbi:MAG: hypothetical protein PHE89_05940 [Alphaproteobacteria bacterium]|nr:hypothetical protein [Alphaproteobacteria bacterium]
MMRIIIVGCFWSVFFLEGIRVIMLRNWRFDIISYEHWEYAWDLWMSGWVISDAKEWAFVLIIITFIPLWITGWAALSIVSWENLFLDALQAPINLFKKIFHKQLVGIMKIKNSTTKIKKKLSYKEVRPRGPRILGDENLSKSTQTGSTAQTVKPRSDKSALKSSLKKSKKNLGIEDSTPKSNVFEHSLLTMDGEGSEDDFVFNFDAFDVETKPEENKRSRNERNNRDKNRDEKEYKPKNRANDDNRDKNRDRDRNKDNRDKDRNNRDNNKDKDRNKKQRNDVKTPGFGNISEIIKQKGYETITGTTIKNTLVDFIGVSKKSICICLLDREPGDWLADEEKFNDEEPLWFSETSHRISPVRKIDTVKKQIEEVLSETDYNNMKVDAYVIIQLGNIINAEDMFNVWNDMNISVARIDRGTPKDIMLFAKSLQDADEKISEQDFEDIKKIIRNIK